ncbi:hypothetical protein LCGC14_0763270 [marine sediment metagenome]|uniref:Uncharacterized protein n=1 Tax=marine sediment metagenome TaxID=412755 RepID=A0A0F9T7I5_9ZZZZ
MAEENDTTSDEQTSADAAKNSASKKGIFGLSKSLIIKISIALVVVIIISVAAIFFLTGDKEDSGTAENTESGLVGDEEPDFDPIDDTTDDDALPAIDLNDEEDSALPAIDDDFAEDEEEQSALLPTILKPGESDPDIAKISQSANNDMNQDNSPKIDTSNADTDVAKMKTQTDAIDKLVNPEQDEESDTDEVATLQQRLSKERQDNRELIKQIQELSNQNKRYKTDTITQEYAAPPDMTFGLKKPLSEDGKIIDYKSAKSASDSALAPKWGE